MPGINFDNGIALKIHNVMRPGNVVEKKLRQISQILIFKAREPQIKTNLSFPFSRTRTGILVRQSCGRNMCFLCYEAPGSTVGFLPFTSNFDAKHFGGVENLMSCEGRKFWERAYSKYE